ncbi:MAG TPA: TonB-dependent receptor [Steroidobacteraceae bacterium]|nr:TonB-dependent receptor [Steroidobacteraceae bacterium]
MYRRSLSKLAALLVAGGFAAAWAPLPALAQQAPPSADASGAADENLQQIVVTARHYSEKLQDVPMSVAAVSAETLTAMNVGNLDDLNSFVPNMKISAGRATNSTINAYIRGVGQNDPLWGFEPGVGIYMDDVYLARPQSALLDVYDVERVEVLSGPQGTLYGKNTIAGAVKYITRDIVGPAHASATVTVGNYDQTDGKLSFSTPVIDDHVYFGAAVAMLHHDGYGQVVAEGAPSPYNRVGQDVSDKDVLAARANLTFVWGESSKLKLLADTIQDNSNAAGGQRLNGYLAPMLNSRYDTRTDMPVNRDRFLTGGGSVTYTQDLTSQLALKVVGAYRQGDGRQFIDFEELNTNLFQVPGHYADHQSSGEGQLTFTNDLVKAVGGVFYMDSTACGQFDASIGILAAPPPAGFGLYLTSLTAGCVLTKTTAVYADATWKLTSRLNLDTGLRWNSDDKTANVYVAQYASLAPVQLLPNQTFFSASNVPTGFFPFGGGLNGTPGLESDYTRERTFANVSPRIGLDYHFTPAVLGYFTYSKGFKSGGFDMRGNQLVFPDTQNGYNSETADNFELGVKSTLLDDTLQLNGAVFYTPYRDAQIGVQGFELVAGAPTNVTAVLNAGKQINRGVELESVWRPVRPLTVDLNVGYLDAYFENVAGCIPGSVGCNSALNVANLNRPINAPAWTASLVGSYLWALSSGSLLAHAGWDWRSFTKVANTTDSVTDQPAYGILNGGLAYTTANGSWRVALEGRNLLDRWYRVAGYDFGNPPIGSNLLGGVSQIGFYGAPRTYQLSVQYTY